MAKDQNLEEVLIARNNDTGQVGAVTGLNEDGTPKMTDVKSAKLSDLVKFSKGQNPLEAFLSNFVRQCKNPTTFGFFRVPADRYDTVGTANQREVILFGGDLRSTSFAPPFGTPITVIFCRFLRPLGKQKIPISFGNQDFTVFCFSSKWCHQHLSK